MTSAWGSGWGTSWGNSWGSVSGGGGSGGASGGAWGSSFIDWGTSWGAHAGSGGGTSTGGAWGNHFIHWGFSWGARSSTPPAPTETIHGWADGSRFLKGKNKHHLKKNKLSFIKELYILEQKLIQLDSLHRELIAPQPSSPTVEWKRAHEKKIASIIRRKSRAEKKGVELVDKIYEDEEIDDIMILLNLIN